LVLLFTPSCSRTSDSSTSSVALNELKVGFPENSVGGPNVGLRELTDGQTLESLTQVGTDGKAVPSLAERWVWENDYRRLRLKLRPGVALHDGTDLDAGRMAAALSQVVNRPANRALYPSFGDITSIQAAGDLEIVIDLSRRSAFLPEDLVLNLGIGPQNVGSGPYRMVENDGSDIVLERFDQYRLGRPRIERIIIRPFETLRTAWTSLLRGELDMVTDVPPDAIEFIRNDQIQVLPFQRRYQYLIAFNSRRAPFDRPDVRRALNLAVNRPGLIDKVLPDRGTPSTGPLWPRYWAYDGSIAPFAFEPDRAAGLLDAAGFAPARFSEGEDRAPARLRFTCLLPVGYSVLERIALEVQKDLYNIGVDMQFQVVPFRDFDALVREGRFEAALIDLISGPTPSRAYIFWQSPEHHKGFNVFGYNNPDAERLFEILRSESNEGAVRSATRRLQSVFLEDPPALFLAWNQRARAIRSDVEINQESDQDPMLTMWRWGPTTERPLVSAE
jgi:peptide/nickel transport system substrate-binding protein